MTLSITGYKQITERYLADALHYRESRSGTMAGSVDALRSTQRTPWAKWP
jgi:hypothetical protein